MRAQNMRRICATHIFCARIFCPVPEYADHEYALNMLRTYSKHILGAYSGGYVCREYVLAFLEYVF